MGTEDTTAESAGWADRNKPQNSADDVRVLYLAPFTISTPDPQTNPTVSIGNGLTFSKGLILKRRV